MPLKVPPEQRLAIIGLGLIGGSVLRGTVARGLAAEARAWDVSPEAMAAAREAGYTAHLAPSLEEACRGATLAVVAVPVRDIPTLVDFARRRVRRDGGVVTDTGSAKVWISGEVARLAGEKTAPSPAPYVGGHPIAGTEHGGFGSSQADLFDGQPWVIVGVAGEAVARVAAFARGLGAEPVFCPAADHDRALALTSHLPYLLAASLAVLAGERLGPPERVASLAAGGFRDATRLALQDPKMGLDFLAANAGEIAGALEALTTAAGRLLGDARRPSAGSRGAAPSPSADPAAVLERAAAYRRELGRLKRWP